MDAPQPSPVKPCWVTGLGGRQPALLLGWRRTPADTWEGRVVRPILEGSSWVIVDEWVPAELLEKG